MKEEKIVKSSRYKRGTASHDGNSRPFAQMVDVDGKTYLRVRQTTELGYVDCPVGGCCGLSYPNSTSKRGRVIRGGYDNKNTRSRPMSCCTGGGVGGMCDFD